METHDGTSEAARRVLILGASGGIGSALARHIAAGDGRVFLASRDSDRLDELATELGAPACALDARDATAVSGLIAQADSELGGLDAVVHCVGSLLLKPMHATSPADFDDVISTNLVSASNVIRAAAPVMRKAGGGALVFVSSAAARVGLANHEAIAAAKAGVEGLALSAAATYASANIRVNVVAPGLVETPLTERLTSSPASRAASEAMHALGRLGAPQDVASGIAWVLSSPWMTGQVIGIDGGLSRVRGRGR